MPDWCDNARLPAYARETRCLVELRHVVTHELYMCRSTADMPTDRNYYARVPLSFTVVCYRSGDSVGLALPIQR